MNKAIEFRKLIESGGHFFLMEAHDGLSAKIVEEAGFPAIWASGLSITASLGVRDNNEISYTQLLDVLEYMNDASQLPILVDGDTGYGNFNNACRLLKKLEKMGIAAVCIEDKKFPKTNSFLETKMEALADPLEFSGKIRAMKAAQETPDFTVIARLESLIVGAGVADAVKRAKMYLEAGADALLVHSKKSTSKDIDDFLESFPIDIPIFIVPTKYYTVPISHFTKDKRIRGIIWANHNVRACVTAMQKICKKIYEESSIAGVEEMVAPVSELFRLQKNEEYLEMEKKYLPTYPDVSAVILAAGSPGALNFNKPKSLLRINGKSILEHQLDVLKAVGISDIRVVRGYRAEEIQGETEVLINNTKWESTNSPYSLFLGAASVEKPYLVLYGDVFFKKFLLRTIFSYAGEHQESDVILVCVRDDYINAGYSLILNKRPDIFGDDETLKVQKIQTDSFAEDESLRVYFSGFLMVNNHERVRKVLNQKDIEQMHMADFMKKLLDVGLKLSVILSSREDVVDINSLNDLMKAGEIL